eukprot:FR735108.1.p3 GENE.FR735108.1~~FR735108.1.p3  ORF type:complete len:103 (+),score=59.58 FR735108.1:906-1214(+)
MNLPNAGGKGRLGIGGPFPFPPSLNPWPRDFGVGGEGLTVSLKRGGISGFPPKYPGVKSQGKKTGEEKGAPKKRPREKPKKRGAGFGWRFFFFIKASPPPPP